MFALTLMQGPAKILIANVRIGLYGNISSVIYRYLVFSLSVQLVSPLSVQTKDHKVILIVQAKVNNLIKNSPL